MSRLAPARRAPLRRRRPGFTLAELAVVGAISALTMALVLGSFESQKRSFEAVEVGRAGQEQSREGMSELERSLRTAAFGMNPAFAFDFRTYRCATPPCRDRINAPDELVFMGRNSRYQASPLGVDGCATAPACVAGNAWVVKGVTSTTLTLAMRTGQRLRKGTVMLLMCSGGSTSTMVTLGTTIATLTADGNASSTLQAQVTGNPYRENALTNTCFTSGSALAFQIDRRRYYVELTAFEVPYLMLDTGVDVNGNGQSPEDGDNDDLLPVARGVDDLQIGYVLNRSATAVAPDRDRDWIVANTSGFVEEADPTATAPGYSTPDTDATRFNLHPSNIRAVRATIGTRSDRSDPGPDKSWTGDKYLLFENRSTAGGLGTRLRRFSASTTVTVRNMASRALFAY